MDSLYRIILQVCTPQFYIIEHGTDSQIYIYIKNKMLGCIGDMVGNSFFSAKLMFVGIYVFTFPQH
jgi:hypothetical protein